MATGRVLILLALGYFVLCPTAQAVTPAPDGGYPGYNTAEGQNALFSLTTGLYKTALGAYTLFGDTTGNGNTAVGISVLRNNVIGSFNTGVALNALFTNNGDPAAGHGSNNCALGAYALFANTRGDSNTATGYQALFNNSTASFNTAAGGSALRNNTTGTGNTATGYQALLNNTQGDDNTANGQQALRGNTTGSANTGIGDLALQNNTRGFGNVAVGAISLLGNTTGDSNTAVGPAALQNASTGSNNTAIGDSAGLAQNAGSDNVYIGEGIQGVDGENNTCRIKSIFGQTAANGSAVFITSGNKLGTDTSSKRFKEEIKPMDRASEALLALKPITFRYKKEIDSDRKSQFGLVAEDVEKVNPDLVVRDKEGQPYSVRFDQVNAMLLNEFLKEHKTVQDLKFTVQKQEAMITQQQQSFESKLAEQDKRIESLTSGLQKVSAHLEMTKSTRQVVVNNR